VAALVNGQAFNSGTLSTHLHIDARLAAIGLGWACAIAILGGLFPALKAARMPIATALRES
jgi:putative ABC transport system permease protein